MRKVPRAERAIRKDLAALRTAWNRRSIHDRYVRHIGRASKIYPMNGPRECARRVWQQKSAYARSLCTDRGY